MTLELRLFWSVPGALSGKKEEKHFRSSVAVVDFRLLLLVLFIGTVIVI